MNTLARTARLVVASALLLSPAIAGAILCLPGTYDNGTMCVDCSPGSYQDVSGATTCIECNLGYYQDLSGQTACSQCAPGSYSDVPGTVTCPDCPVGKYQSSAGQTTCLDCSPGFYQDLSGQSVCTQCAPGSYSDVPGTVTCPDCPVGKYQSLGGQTTCLDCAPGTYQDQIGQLQCLDCPGGAATPCSDNGMCADGAGDGTCTCDPGYIGSACENTELGVTAKKLIVIDKLAVAGKAKVVYVSKDTTAGITKGAGTKPTDVDASFVFGYDGSFGHFTMPQGSNWIVDKSTVAKYVNKSAPDGGGVKVSVLKPNKLIKVVGASLGDVPIDLFTAGPPATDVATAYTITNAGDTNRFCTSFAASSVTFKEIAGGEGRKLVAKNGVPGPCPASPSGAFLD